MIWEAKRTCGGFLLSWLKYSNSLKNTQRVCERNSRRTKIPTLTHKCFTEECGTHWTKSSTGGRGKGRALVVFKVELLIFSACSFSIIMLPSTKSYNIIFIMSVATLPKDERAMGEGGGHKLMQLNWLGSQNHDSAKARESFMCFNTGHLWLRYHNLTLCECWMFELRLWGDPTHKSPSDLIILNYAQFHLQLPKQIVQSQVADAGGHKTKPGGSKSLEVTKENESPRPTFHASTRWRSTPEPQTGSNQRLHRSVTSPLPAEVSAAQSLTS